MAEFNMSQFYEMIRVTYNLYAWELDEKGALLYTNCPEYEPLQILLGRHLETLLPRNPQLSFEDPVLYTSAAGLVWAGDFEISEEELKKIYIIGPAFANRSSAAAIGNELDDLGISMQDKRRILGRLEKIPLVPVRRLTEYLKMLHIAIRNEKTYLASIQFLQDQNGSRGAEGDNERNQGSRDHDYEIETMMLKLIEEGNPSYWKIRNSLVGSFSNYSDQLKNPSRQLKNNIIVLTALCARAAIRGGLSPTVAYRISDDYIYQAEAAKTLDELSRVSTDMQTEFVNRVREARESGGLSPQIAEICDYISTHLQERLKAEEMAAKSGYSVTHFSRLFKEQTGSSYTEYLMDQRLETAKIYLKSGKHTIEEIAALCGFTSQSRFIEQFRRKYGKTPGAYRKEQS